MKKIILVTGGQRSGKSSYAEKMALELAGMESPVYMATARVWDDEFAKRVQLHKDKRRERWINIEEEKELSRHNLTGKVVVIDCVTLWATNFFFDNSTSNDEVNNKDIVHIALEQLKAEFNKFIGQDSIFIFVTNEIGLGEVSNNKLQRQFTDLQGWLNQYIATKADKVVLMVSGIPLNIK